MLLKKNGPRGPYLLRKKLDPRLYTPSRAHLERLASFRGGASFAELCARPAGPFDGWIEVGRREGDGRSWVRFSHKTGEFCVDVEVRSDGTMGDIAPVPPEQAWQVAHELDAGRGVPVEDESDVPAAAAFRFGLRPALLSFADEARRLLDRLADRCPRGVIARHRSLLDARAAESAELAHAQAAAGALPARLVGHPSLESTVTLGKTVGELIVVFSLAAVASDLRNAAPDEPLLRGFLEALGEQRAELARALEALVARQPLPLGAIGPIGSIQEALRAVAPIDPRVDPAVATTGLQDAVFRLHDTRLQLESALARSDSEPLL